MVYQHKDIAKGGIAIWSVYVEDAEIKEQVQGVTTMLNQEREFFESHRQDWLVHYADRFVLVKGKRLVGVFSTIDEALSEGTRLFGLNSFLIRQVKPSEEEIYVPALTLGLLSATSSSSK